MQRGKIFRKSSSWHLRCKTYRFVDGMKLWQTTSTKLAVYDLRHRTQQSVEAEAADFLKGLSRVKPTGVLAKGVKTFKEQSEIWLQRCETRQRRPIKPATLRNLKSHLKVHIHPRLQNVLLPDVTNKVVRDFVATLKLSPKSIRNVVQVIKMVKASAIDDDGNELYPTKWNHDFIDMPQVNPRAQHQPSFSAEQIEKIIKDGDRRMQMLIVLAAATGLRAGELFGLEVKHFDGSSIAVEQEAWSGIIQAPKTVNALRTIELHPTVAKLLKNYIGTRAGSYIFPSASGKPVHDSNFLRRELHPLLRAVGIPKEGFHGFRRYRNTFLRNIARCPDGLLKYWLGHADRGMSALFDKVREDPKFRRAGAKKMGGWFCSPEGLESRENKV
jgi:integrase